MYHHIQIEKALGIQGIMTEASSWRSESTQIDLVISRADRVIDLCEIKFWEGPFSITKKYRQELDNKINSFRDSLKLRRTIHLVFITTYGQKPNEYSGVVQNEVTLKDLFE